MSDKPAPPAEATDGRLPARACYASSVPAMEVKTTPGVHPLYELEGWDELNRWGMLNHPQWSAIQRRLEWAESMSETDKLRLLAGEMLRLSVDLMERYLETVRLIPPPPIFIPSHNASAHTQKGRERGPDNTQD
jgi:hypothetical protein